MKLIYDSLDRAGIYLPRWFHVVVILFVAVFLFYKYALPALKKIYKLMKDFENAVEDICKIDHIETKLNSLENEIKTEQDKVTKDSNNIYVLSESIDALHTLVNENSSHLEGIIDRLEKIEEKNDEQLKNELKDRISQSYRYYNAKKKWNKIEKESLEGLISAYESCKDGANSFVHSVVQKEMYTWELIDEDNNLS